MWVLSHFMASICCERFLNWVVCFTEKEFFGFPHSIDTNVSNLIIKTAIHLVSFIYNYFNCYWVLYLACRCQPVFIRNIIFKVLLSIPQNIPTVFIADLLKIVLEEMCFQVVKYLKFSIQYLFFTFLNIFLCLCGFTFSRLSLFVNNFKSCKICFV